MNKEPCFTPSFSEGNSLNILEVTSKSTLDELMNHNALINFSHNKDKTIYRLASHDKAHLLPLADELSKNKRILNINFNVA